MLTSTASGGVSLSGPANVYTSSRKHGITPVEEKEHKYDSAHFSTVQGGDTAFRKELISHISKEVRTATTTGDIQKYRREILEGTYTPDPMAIAGRILFFSEDWAVEKQYQELFSLMEKLGEGIERITELAKQKNEAALKDDVLALNEIINHEQAEALSFRGMERRQAELLKELGLEGIPMSKLAEKCPEQLRSQAEAQAKKLQNQYQIYRGCADAVRRTMENSMKDIDHILASMGKQEVGGPGYEEQPIEPTAKMRTDFHA